MTILGLDCSPEYQPNLDIHRAHREGIKFAAVKLSDSAKGTERYEDGVRVLRQARSLGMPAFAYHFMRDGAGVERDASMIVDQCRRAGVPVALDWESAGESKPGIDQLRSLAYEVWSSGIRVCFTYAPRWYHQQQGAPSLSGLPPLWASRFVTDANRVERTGTPAQIATGIDPSWWEPYGGRPVRVLQFTSKASIAGFTMDADAYQGTVAELEREVYGA